jgi:putative ABC transport system permease protein
MAQQYFAGQNPIGRRIRWAFEETPRWITIVGVVADVRHFGLADGEAPAVYTPYAQSTQEWKRWMDVVVKAPAAEAALVRQVKERAWSVDPRLPLTRVMSMQNVLAASLEQRRFLMFLLLLFAGIAVALAAIGIYGVTAYAVGKRMREIGLRMALGASARDVYWHIVGGGLRLTAVGVIAGVAGALALTQFLQSLLFGVSRTDPVTYVAVALALALVALVACTLPALRAARLDPMEALRRE